MAHFQRQEKIENVYDLDNMVCIGRGGRCGVKEIHRSLDNKGFAVKILKLANPHCSSYIDACVVRELSFLQGLRNPHILHAHDVCFRHMMHIDKLMKSKLCLKPSSTKKNSIYAIMEKFPADLKTITSAYIHRIMKMITEGKLTEEQIQKHISVVKRYMIMVLESVAALHSYGIMHRDIKPENFLVSFDSSRMLISDFGTARRVMEYDVLFEKPDSQYTTCQYTPSYISPEAENGIYTLTTDLWSTGCVLGELITGQTIFLHADNQFKRVNAIKRLLGSMTLEDEESYRNLGKFHPEYYFREDSSRLPSQNGEISKRESCSAPAQCGSDLYQRKERNLIYLQANNSFPVFGASETMNNNNPAINFNSVPQRPVAQDAFFAEQNKNCMQHRPFTQMQESNHWNTNHVPDYPYSETSSGPDSVDLLELGDDDEDVETADALGEDCGFGFYSNYALREKYEKYYQSNENDMAYKVNIILKFYPDSQNPCEIYDADGPADERGLTSEEIFRKRFHCSIFGETCMDLLKSFLRWDPKKRITAEEALSHPFFKEAPLPCDPKDMPTMTEINKLLNDNKKKRVVRHSADTHWYDDDQGYSDLYYTYSRDYSDYMAENYEYQGMGSSNRRRVHFNCHYEELSDMNGGDPVKNESFAQESMSPFVLSQVDKSFHANFHRRDNSFSANMYESLTEEHTNENDDDRKVNQEFTSLALSTPGENELQDDNFHLEERFEGCDGTRRSGIQNIETRKRCMAEKNVLKKHTDINQSSLFAVLEEDDLNCENASVNENNHMDGNNSNINRLREKDLQDKCNIENQDNSCIESGLNKSYLRESFYITKVMKESYNMLTVSHLACAMDVQEFNRRCETGTEQVFGLHSFKCFRTEEYEDLKRKQHPNIARNLAIHNLNHHIAPIETLSSHIKTQSITSISSSLITIDEVESHTNEIGHNSKAEHNNMAIDLGQADWDVVTIKSHHSQRIYGYNSGSKAEEMNENLNNAVDSIMAMASVTEDEEDMNNEGALAQDLTDYHSVDGSTGSETPVLARNACATPSFSTVFEPSRNHAHRRQLSSEMMPTSTPDTEGTISAQLVSGLRLDDLNTPALDERKRLPDELQRISEMQTQPDNSDYF